MRFQIVFILYVVSALCLVSPDLFAEYSYDSPYRRHSAYWQSYPYSWPPSNSDISGYRSSNSVPYPQGLSNHVDPVAPSISLSTQGGVRYQAPPYSLLSIDVTRDCKRIVQSGNETTEGGNAYYECPQFDDVAIGVHQRFYNPFVPSPSVIDHGGGKYTVFPTTVGLDETYSFLFPGSGNQIALSIARILPGMQPHVTDGMLTTESGKPIELIRTRQPDGTPHTQLMEITVTGRLGERVPITGALQKVSDQFTSRLFVKVTPQESCVVAAIGTAAPLTYSLSSGYQPCEYLNDMSERLRGAQLSNAAAGKRVAQQIRESLLQDMPSCGSINGNKIRNDALIFPGWSAVPPNSTPMFSRTFPPDTCLADGTAGLRFRNDLYGRRR